LLYTYEGGLTAVIWTDVVQMFLYVGGAILSLFVILGKIPGGWDHVMAVAEPMQKLRVFDFQFALTAEFFRLPYTFWAGLIGGALLTTASHGTEQLMVQRLLAAPSQRESRLALFSSWFVILFQFTLFLVIGLILFVYYRDNNLTPPAKLDQIYPLFVWNELPPGVSGLVIAAILAAAMSNLSAALNSLASTTVMDFIRPMEIKAGRARTEEGYLSLARRCTLLWGIALFVIGLASNQIQGVLEAGLGIASIVYGSLLGVFLLGVLTTSVQERAAMTGMLTGLLVMLYVRFGTQIAWTWYVLIGASVTLVTALCMSALLKEKPLDVRET
jgi:solute:Na+ symporter, SSS family